jgi:hypothetical protein
MREYAPTEANTYPDFLALLHCRRADALGKSKKRAESFCSHHSARKNMNPIDSGNTNTPLEGKSHVFTGQFTQLTRKIETSCNSTWLSIRSPFRQLSIQLAFKQEGTSS